MASRAIQAGRRRAVPETARASRRATGPVEQSGQAEAGVRRLLDRRSEEHPRRGPDVLIDVPVVKVDEIDLEVEDLHAQVAVMAEVRDLVQLSVGADARLGKVELKIEGVEAQALLKARLDNVTRDPRAGADDARPQPRAARERRARGGGGRRRCRQDPGGRRRGGGGRRRGRRGRGSGRRPGRGPGGGPDRPGRKPGRGQVGQGAGQAASQVGQGAGQAVGQVGQGAGQGVAGVGQGAKQATDKLSRAAGSEEAVMAQATTKTAVARAPSNGRSASQKTEKYRFAQNVDGEGTVAERSTAATRPRDGRTPAPTPTCCSTSRS